MPFEGFENINQYIVGYYVNSTEETVSILANLKVRNTEENLAIFPVQIKTSRQHFDCASKILLVVR